MNVYEIIGYEALRTFFGPFLDLLLRVKLEGEQNTPEEGGALLILNHSSILDIPVLATHVDRYIHFLASSTGIIPVARSLYRMSGVRDVLAKRGGPILSDEDKAIQLLEEGEIVGVFPEGIEFFTRPQKATRVGYFRTDFARIALKAKVPIIPVAIIPQEEAKLPLPARLMDVLISPSAEKDRPVRLRIYKRIFVRIGKPVSLSGYLKEPLSKVAIDTLSGKIRRIVIKLYDGEDLDRFLTGEKPFDIYTDRV